MVDFFKKCALIKGMKTLLSFLIVGITLSFSIESIARCYGDDRLERTSQRVETLSCTTSGRCNAYGYNPATGRYEYYYGNHPNCPGRQQRTNTIYHCLNSLGVGYTVERYGSWGFCRAN
jgi:hypothetical protein